MYISQIPTDCTILQDAENAKMTAKFIQIDSVSISKLQMPWKVKPVVKENDCVEFEA